LSVSSLAVCYNWRYCSHWCIVGRRTWYLSVLSVLWR